jgi:purine-binding chemotaxis protein CheW
MAMDKMAMAEAAAPARQLVSMVVAGHSLGIDIGTVRDILGVQQLARVPLAPPEIAGVLNLRGRIVTAIDMRRRLGLGGDAGAADLAMNVVVEHKGELYSLLVDRIGEVLTLRGDRFEADLVSLPSHWRPLARGIFRLDAALLVELDVERVLAIEPVV